MRAFMCLLKLLAASVTLFLYGNLTENKFFVIIPFFRGELIRIEGEWVEFWWSEWPLPLSFMFKFRLYWSHTTKHCVTCCLRHKNRMYVHGAQEKCPLQRVLLWASLSMNMVSSASSSASWCSSTSLPWAAVALLHSCCSGVRWSDLSCDEVRDMEQMI